MTFGLDSESDNRWVHLLVKLGERVWRCFMDYHIAGMALEMVANEDPNLFPVPPEKLTGKWGVNRNGYLERIYRRYTTADLTMAVPKLVSAFNLGEVSARGKLGASRDGLLFGDGKTAYRLEMGRREIVLTSCYYPVTITPIPETTVSFHENGDLAASVESFMFPLAKWERLIVEQAKPLEAKFTKFRYTNKGLLAYVSPDNITVAWKERDY